MNFYPNEPYTVMHQDPPMRVGRRHIDRIEHYGDHDHHYHRDVDLYQQPPPHYHTYVPTPVYVQPLPPVIKAPVTRIHEVEVPTTEYVPSTTYETVRKHVDIPHEYEEEEQYVENVPTLKSRVVKKQGIIHHEYDETTPKTTMVPVTTTKKIQIETTS